MKNNVNLTSKKYNLSKLFLIVSLVAICIAVFSGAYLYNFNDNNSSNLSTSAYNFNATPQTEYTIYIDGNGVHANSTKYTVSANEQTILLPTLTYDKYTFSGWEIVENSTPTSSIDANNLVIPQNATGNIRVKAIWERFYTISFISNTDQNYETVRYDYKSDVYQLKDLPTPSKLGYTFVKWDFVKNTQGEISYINDNVLKISQRAYGDITLEAQFTLNNYKVTVDLNGGQGSFNLNYNFSKDLQTLTLEEPTRLGHTFSGWEFVSNSNPVATINKNTITLQPNTIGNIEVKAMFIPLVYTITFVDSFTETETTATYTYSDIDQSIELEDLNKVGYNFLGWKLVRFSEKFTVEGKQLKIKGKTTEDVTLISQFNAKVFNIVIDTDGGNEIENKTYTYSALNTKIDLENPYKEGYTFTGWEFVSNSKPKAVIDQDGKMEIMAFSQNDISIKAIYVYGYKIDIDVNGGQPLDYKLYELKNKPQTIELPIPVKPGYTFKFWQIETNTLNPSKIQDNSLIIPAYTKGELKLKAIYVEQKFKITYDVNGGEEFYTETTFYSKSDKKQEIILEYPYKLDARFNTWVITTNTVPASSINNGYLIVPKDAEGDIALKASWLMIGYVCYNLNPYDQFGRKIEGINDGEDVEEFVLGGTISNMRILTKKGYKFEGWYLDKDFTNKIDNKKTISKDYYEENRYKDPNETKVNYLKLYAKWTKVVTPVTAIQKVTIAVSFVFALFILLSLGQVVYKNVKPQVEIDENMLEIHLINPQAKKELLKMIEEKLDSLNDASAEQQEEEINKVLNKFMDDYKAHQKELKQQKQNKAKKVENQDKTDDDIILKAMEEPSMQEEEPKKEQKVKKEKVKAENVKEEKVKEPKPKKLKAEKPKKEPKQKKVEIDLDKLITTDDSIEKQETLKVKEEQPKVVEPQVKVEEEKEEKPAQKVEEPTEVKKVTKQSIKQNIIGDEDIMKQLEMFKKSKALNNDDITKVAPVVEKTEEELKQEEQKALEQKLKEKQEAELKLKAQKEQEKLEKQKVKDELKAIKQSLKNARKNKDE